MKISVLYLGHILCQRLHLVACEDESTMIRSPIPALLIKHPTLGNILYDTGNSPFYKTVYTKEMLETYPIAEFISIDEALAAHGLGPHDIDMIILSHLHFDHVGGLRYFVGTKALQNVWISEADLQNAYSCTVSGQGGAYIKELFDIEGVCFHPVKEDMNLAPDLRLILRDSHTPGVLCLLMETKQHGQLLTTSDTIYTVDSFEKSIPPGGSINKTQSEFFDNLAVFRALRAQYDATLLFGHDYEQIRSFAQAGEFE